ncbi:insulinase family protein [Candidatus Azambacteria bacterium]|nr:insulinase family protein [Candidatus Azambacteria bacterium]
MPNGLSIITSENKNSEIVNISVWIRAGSRYETKEQRGYAHLLEHMLFKGTKKFPSSFKVNVNKDRVGALSNAFTGPERIYFFIQVARKHAEKMFELLADIILNPIIDAKVLETEKQVVIQEIKRVSDDYFKYLWKETYKKIFQNHPLAQDPLGEEESILKAKAENLREYHEKFFIPNRSAIIVTGNISHNKILKLTDRFFNNWKRGFEFDNLKSPPGARDRRMHIEKNNSQSQLIFDFVCPAIGIKEYSIFEIVKNYLSYGSSSILNQELRQKRGLVYNISSSISAHRDAFLFSIETSTTKPLKAIKVILENINNFEKNFDKKVFTELKDQTLNILARQMNDSLNELKFLGLFWNLHGKLITPKDYIGIIKKATYRNILDAKKKYLTEDNLFISTLGKSDFKL